MDHFKLKTEVIMKTQNKNLAFTKNSIVELNRDQLNQVNGGANSTTVGTTSTIIITIIKDLPK